MAEKHFYIPHIYGDNKIVLMIKNPSMLYTYWEITSENENMVREKINDEKLTVTRNVLRLTRIDLNRNDNYPLNIEDFDCPEGANNWYLTIKPSRGKWRTSVGFISDNGQFFPLAESNIVETPSGGPSGADEAGQDLDIRYGLFASNRAF